MKLRNQTVPGLDEAARAMFSAYERVIDTYHHPASLTVRRKVDSDLYLLEKACWEIICEFSRCTTMHHQGHHTLTASDPIGATEYQKFPGKNPDPTAEVNNLLNKHGNTTLEPRETINASAVESMKSCAKNSSSSYKISGITEESHRFYNSAGHQVLSPSPQNKFQVQVFLEQKGHTTSSSSSTSKTSIPSLVYKNVPPILCATPQEYVPPHMRYQAQHHIVAPKPIEAARLGHIDSCPAPSGQATNTFYGAKACQKNRQLVPDINAIGRILNHDLGIKKNELALR